MFPDLCFEFRYGAKDAEAVHAAVLLPRVVIKIADGLVVQAGTVLQFTCQCLSGVARADDQEPLGGDRATRQSREEAAAHFYESHPGEDQLAGYSDDKAYLLYGAFSSMLFLTPVIGGYIADRYIGFRQSIVIGAVLFIVVYGIMALPNESAMFLGLSVIIVANGFFKPNVSSIVGDLYTEDDPRRDGGFTLFYMGINIGALIPPLFAGALVAAYTWGSGFAIASAGMVVSLLTFLIGIKRIGGAGKMPDSSPLHQRGKGKFYLLLGLGTLAAIAVFEAILLLPGWGNLILIAASSGIIGWVLYYLFQERPDQKRRLTACLILILLSVGFWSLYNQTFTSLMLFADRNMSKEFLGFTIDAEFTQFFNPFFIIVFSPFLSWLWVKLDEKGLDPSTPSCSCRSSIS